MISAKVGAVTDSAHFPVRLLCALAAAILQFAAPTAGSAGSAFEFPMMNEFGEVTAGTYDGAGIRLGDALFSAGRAEDGTVVIEAMSAIEGSASTRFAVKLEPTESGTLRPVYEESRSVDVDGNPLGLLTIDHRKGIATCEPAAHDKDGQRTQIDLPKDDRIANVPLHLLFQPLVQGETDHISFQIVICRPDARIIDAKARVVEKPRGTGGVIEVQYTIDLGFFSRVASPFLPTFSVWFEAKEPNGWIGHRIPLYAQGPTVSILRDGIEPARVGKRGD